MKRTRHEPLETYLKKIEAANHFKDLVEPTDDVAKMYKRYARIVHPDVVPEEYKKRATAAIAKLNQLYMSLTKAAAPVQCVIAGYVVTNPFARGDIADLYEAEHESGLAHIVKIVRKPVDNDLMDREAAALAKLKPKGKSDNFHKYLPQLQVRTKASGRRTNIFCKDTGYQPLDFIQERCGGSIEDFRHIVWMGNRALSALGYVHTCGIVHGAVVPSHLLYSLPDHGLKLIDWCYSCDLGNGDRVPAIVKDFKDLYAPEILKKKPASPSTDLFMLMASLRKVAGKVPSRFRDLMNWCMAGPPSSRPHDAWAIQDRWIKLAREEYGPAKFVELHINNK